MSGIILTFPILADKELIDMRTQKDKDRRRKQQRQRKVHYLRRRIVGAKDPKERERLIAKLQRISPRAPIPGS